MRNRTVPVIIISIIIFMGWTSSMPMAQNISSPCKISQQITSANAETDYLALRMSYAKSQSYNPYDTQIKELRDKVWENVSTKHFRQALRIADEILEKDPLDIQTHALCDYIYNSLGDKKKALHHQIIARGLINSIITSGDGESCKTAYKVISVAEEYALLFIMNLEGGSQWTLETNGSYFDRMVAVNPNTKEEHMIYFNIDIPRNWLNKVLK